MLLDASAAGLFPIAPTPFGEDGALDLASVDTLTAGYIAAGATGITVLGIMGEAPKLEADEATILTRRVIANMDGLPVIVGVSAPGFAAMRSLTRAVMDQGAAGVMIAPPSSLRIDEQITVNRRRSGTLIGAEVEPHSVDNNTLTAKAFEAVDQRYTSAPISGETHAVLQSRTRKWEVANDPSWLLLHPLVRRHLRGPKGPAIPLGRRLRRTASGASLPRLRQMRRHSPDRRDERNRC